MKVRIDKILCSGTGLCQGTCPEVFEVGNDGLGEVLLEEVPSEYEDACREAADGCPTGAIIIEE